MDFFHRLLIFCACAKKTQQADTVKVRETSPAQIGLS